MTRIAVFDLEYTAWEGSLQRRWSEPWEEREVVQIGAVKLEAETPLEEVDTLELLITPRINPELSDYFVDLTGITREQLAAHGRELADALASFEDFVADCARICCFGSDNVILRQNCDLIGIEFPFEDETFTNVRPAVVDYLGPRADDVISSRLPELLGFSSPGDAHGALADSRCIAEALRVLRTAGAF